MGIEDKAPNYRETDIKCCYTCIKFSEDSDGDTYCDLYGLDPRREYICDSFEGY